MRKRGGQQSKTKKGGPAHHQPVDTIDAIDTGAEREEEEDPNADS